MSEIDEIRTILDKQQTGIEFLKVKVQEQLKATHSLLYSLHIRLVMIKSFAEDGDLVETLVRINALLDELEASQDTIREAMNRGKDHE